MCIIKVLPITLFIAILSFSGCSFEQKHQEQVSTVRVNLSSKEKRPLPLSYFISNVYTIKLKLPTRYFFGVITDILFTDSSIFIVDKKQGEVFRFKKDGTFLNKIGGKGEAPEEYHSLHRFFIGDEYVYISDMSIRKIYCYAHDGTYVKTISSRFELVYDDIEVLTDGKFLCHDIQGRKGEDKIWIMNEKGEKEKTLLSHENNFPYSYTDWNTIYHSDYKNLEILDPITGTVYLYDAKKKRVMGVFHLCSEEKGLSAFKNIENYADIKKDYAYPSFIINGSNYLYSIWTTSGTTALCSLYEKKRKTYRVFDMPKMDFPGYSICPIPLSTNLPNAMVGIVTDEYPIESLPRQYKHGISEQEAIIIVMLLKTETNEEKIIDP